MDCGIGTAINGVRVWVSSAVVEAPHLVMAKSEDSINSNIFLSKDIISKLNVPPFNNTAVDGYAFKYSDLNKNKETMLKLNGRIAAGQNFNKKIKKGEVARIFTGAKIPEGTDTVIMQEDCSINGNEITLKPGIFKGANIRKKGEDIKSGKKNYIKRIKIKSTRYCFNSINWY